MAFLPHCLYYPVLSKLRVLTDMSEQANDCIISFKVFAVIYRQQLKANISTSLDGDIF